MAKALIDTPTGSEAENSSLGVLVFGAIGVVFGDIGTSPLYTMKETFAGPHPLALDPLHVLGVLSLIFWAVMCIVSLKYVVIIMRADNRGKAAAWPSWRSCTRRPRDDGGSWPWSVCSASLRRPCSMATA
jgi:hypothetical protein